MSITQQAIQLANDDLANGEITSDQLERVIASYVRWLSQERDGQQHRQ